jgi:hypothetical protein
VKKRLILVLAVGAIFPAVALGGSAAKIGYSAKLTGGSETPKGAPAGKGDADIDVTGTKVCWHLTYGGLGGTPTAAHIHKGKAGVAGPVVVPLGAAFKPKGCIAASAAILAGIKKSPAGYYVNIHTAKFPGGAVRGQLQRDY